MSYNDDNSRALVLDIETVACHGAFQYLEPVEPPSNYSKPEAIAAYVEKATAKALEKCSLDPDLCQIVAIGWLLEGETAPYVAMAVDEAQEASALRLFWDAASLPGGGVRRLCSFYGLSFDLPVLMRRSQYLQVPFPMISVDKYRTPHLDLHARLTFNGATKISHGLEFYAKRFGLELPEDTVTGADIARLVAEDQWHLVRRHCEVDVRKTAALAQRLGYLNPAPVPQEVI